MKLPSVRLSVRLSHYSAAARRCNGFAAVGPAARRYRPTAAQPALSSKREQCTYTRCQLTSEAEHRLIKDQVSVTVSVQGD